MRTLIIQLYKCIRDPRNAGLYIRFLFGTPFLGNCPLCGPTYLPEPDHSRYNHP
jgi:hypothetical protein